MTLVSNIHVDKFIMDNVRKMLNGWGFNQGTYRVWTKVIEIDPNFSRLGEMMIVTILLHFLVPMRLRVTSLWSMMYYIFQGH